VKTFERARSADDKQTRRTAMLEAAHHIAAEHEVRSVTLTAIAARTGLHKSAVLRYFDNREALLLTMCQQQWRAWVDELTAAAEGAPTSPTAAAELVSGTLSGRPVFCDLLAQTPVVLEREAPVDEVRQFKSHVLAAVDDAGRAVRALVPSLTDEQAVEFVGVATTLAGTLWHVAHPPAALRSAYAADPALARACVDFAPALTGVLTTYLAGLQVRATPSGRASRRRRGPAR
jgi:AcrR family transcriptional regulator